MRRDFRDFTDLNREVNVISREASRLLDVQHPVSAIPDILRSGPVCLEIHPICETIDGFAVTCKELYALVLLDQAKVSTKSIFVHT